MITSKLTSKAQTTIPHAVRLALGVGEGDEVAYGIEAGRVILSKAPPRPSRGPALADEPFATFAEWESEADRAAFASL